MNYVTVRNMELDGSRGAEERAGYALPSLTIEGDYAKVLANEATNSHKGTCFILGSSPSLAEDTVIQGNRIHDCGRLPRTITTTATTSAPPEGRG
jgi:hypothetical protein